MVHKEQNHTMMYNDRLKELTIRTHTTEIFSKKEIYNVFVNLTKSLKQLEAQAAEFNKSIEEVKVRLKELEPHFLVVKEEVEKEIANEKK